AARGQAEADLERIGHERYRRETTAEPLQHRLEHAREDSQRVDLPVEALRFFPERRRRPGTERIAVDTERQIVSGEAGRPQTRGETFTRQRGQVAERPHAPPAEACGEIRSGGGSGERQLRARGPGGRIVTAPGPSPAAMRAPVRLAASPTRGISPMART